jgi:hypothetical protein
MHFEGTITIKYTMDRTNCKHRSQRWPAQQELAADALQRPLCSRLRARLKLRVSWLFHNLNFPLLSESNLRDKVSSNEGRYRLCSRQDAIRLVSLTNRSSTAWKSLQGARFGGTRTKMPFVFPIRGQAAQNGGGERAGMPWNEGSSGSRPHSWPDDRVRIRRSVGGCCGPGVPWGKDCLLPERLRSQW